LYKNRKKVREGVGLVSGCQEIRRGNERRNSYRIPVRGKTLL